MAPEKRHITRNRTSYSCQTCRRRKVKCDKKHPVCGTCEKNDEECIYSADNEHVPPEDNAAEPSRKRKLESSEPTQTDSAGIAATTSLGDKLARIRLLLDEASALADGTGLGHVAFAPRSSEEQTNESLQSISEKLRSLNLLFKADGKDVKEVASQPVQVARDLSRGEVGANTRPHLNLPPPRDWEKDVSNRSVSDAQRNVLFRSWLFSSYTIFPIVDPFDALEKFNAHHRWYTRDYDKGIPNPVEEHMPLIVAIQYGGLLGLSLRGVRRWFPEVPRRIILAGLRVNFWRIIDKAKPTEHTVAAEVMMRYMCHERYGLSRSSAQLAMLIRNAQTIGLHRTDKYPGIAPSSQVRRRLWWEIVNLDTSLSCACLVPPLLDSRFFDDKLPSELKNHKMGTDESFVYRVASQNKDNTLPSADFAFDELRPSIVSVHHLVSRARALWTSSVRDIATLLMSTGPVTTEHITKVSQILGTVTTEIRAMIERIPTNDVPEANEPPLPNARGESVAMDHGTINGNPIIHSELEYHLGSPADFGESHMPFLHLIELAANTFHRWARISLSMLLDQICCFAFFTFLKDPKSRLWSLTRDCAIQGCLNFFRKYLMLATMIELERYRWTWIGMFQPAHAAKILLLDVYERPFSAEAVKLRALFDQMLLLNYPEYGIVGGDQGLTFLYSLEDESEEGCSILYDLREKAWQKAGLCPIYLWSEQDQLLVLERQENVQSQIRSVATGPARADQPLLPPKQIDEKEWRHDPATHSKSPFGGLTELIQKIRGTQSAEQMQEQVQRHQPELSGSNFYGEQLFTRRNEWTPEYISQRSQPRYQTSIPNAPGVDHNTATQYTLTPQSFGTNSHASAQYGASNGASDTERVSTADLSNEPTQSFPVAESCPTLDLDAAAASNPVQVLPQEASVDFDWDRWDTAFGYPGSNNVQSLASNNADLLMEAFGHS